MPDLMTTYESAGHVIRLVTENPWEWGWDAWVAIGTLTLAIVTVLLIVATVVVGSYNYRQAEKHHKQALAPIFVANRHCNLVDSFEENEIGESYHALRFSAPPRNIGVGPSLGNFANLSLPNNPEPWNLLYAEIPNLAAGETCNFRPEMVFILPNDLDKNVQRPDKFSALNWTGAKLTLVSWNMFGEFVEAQYEYHGREPNSAEEGDPHYMDGDTFIFHNRTFNINKAVSSVKPFRSKPAKRFLGQIFNVWGR